MVFAADFTTRTHPMLLKQKSLWLLIAGSMLFGLCRAGDTLLTARAIAPPNATTAWVLKLAIRPPYQMAAPHLSPTQRFSFDLVPSASACSGTCSGYEAKAACQSGCGFCGHCPDCVNGPCTIYQCTYTGANKSCQTAFNTNKQCPLCENDYTVGCSVKCGGKFPCAASVK
jgi:hypothetical protein